MESNEKVYIDPEKTKEKIFNAAVDLFFSKGFHRTSIRDIANAIGMNSAGIYHHFGNKEGLLLFILEQIAKSLLKYQRHAMKKAKGLDPLERFKQFLISAVHWTLAHPKEGKIFLLTETEFSEEGIVISKRIHHEVLDTAYAEFLNLENGGYLNGRNIRIMGYCFEGVLEAYARYHSEVEDLPIEKRLDEICSFIFGGIVNSGFQKNSSDIS